MAKTTPSNGAPSNGVEPRGFAYYLELDCAADVRALAEECVRRGITITEAARRLGFGDDRKRVKEILESPRRHVAKITHFVGSVLGMPPIVARALCDELTIEDLEALRHEAFQTVAIDQRGAFTDAHKASRALLGALSNLADPVTRQALRAFALAAAGLGTSRESRLTPELAALNGVRQDLTLDRFCNDHDASLGKACEGLVYLQLMIESLALPSHIANEIRTALLPYVSPYLQWRRQLPEDQSFRERLSVIGAAQISRRAVRSWLESRRRGAPDRLPSS